MALHCMVQTGMDSTMQVAGQRLEVQWLRPAQVRRAQTLVFLHEGLGSVALWRGWPQAVCEALGCVGLVYSRRGYGRSEPVPDVRGPAREHEGQRIGRLRPDYMHHEALTVLPALLAAAQVREPVLVGHSDGGTIALLHAAQHPVAGCAVMAPHIMVEPISLAAIAQAREAFVHGPLRARLAPFHDDVDGAFWQWNDVWLSDGFRPFDIRGVLAQIHAPLLAIQGEQDPYGTMAQIDGIALAAPHTRRVKLQDCGHSPQRDQPAAVLAALCDWLATV